MVEGTEFDLGECFPHSGKWFMAVRLSVFTVKLQVLS